MRGTMLKALAAIALLGASPPNTWHVTDTTNNDTGLRSVDALTLHVEDPEFVMLWMDCVDGEPAFYVDWQNLATPRFVVIAVGVNGDVRRYNFERREDPTEHGLRITGGQADALAASLGDQAQMGMTVYVGTGDRSISMPLAGTRSAWTRVKQYCPARKVR